MGESLSVAAYTGSRTSRTSTGSANAGWQPGREHRFDCYSALLAGGGICGGMVYRASDKIAALGQG